MQKAQYKKKTIWVHQNSRHCIACRENGLHSGVEITVLCTVSGARGTGGKMGLRGGAGGGGSCWGTGPGHCCESPNAPPARPGRRALVPSPSHTLPSSRPADPALEGTDTALIHRRDLSIRDESSSVPQTGVLGTSEIRANAPTLQQNTSVSAN